MVGIWCSEAGDVEELVQVLLSARVGLRRLSSSTYKSTGLIGCCIDVIDAADVDGVSCGIERLVQSEEPCELLLLLLCILEFAL